MQNELKEPPSSQRVLDRVRRFYELRRAPDGSGPPGMRRLGGNESIPTRRSLLGRLRRGDDEAAWGEFFNTYWRLIYSVAVKSGLSDAEAQDVVQDTVLAVAKKIVGFDPDPRKGAFKSWLMTLVRWRILDHIRKRNRERRGRVDGAEGVDDDGLIERLPDPLGFELERLWEEEWEHNVLEVALDRVKQQVNPRQYQMFDLYVVKQWPVREVARALGVSTAQVYLAKHRLSKRVRREARTIIG